MCNIVKFLRGHIKEIDTSVARSIDNLGSAHGPRGDSGGLPDSSKGQEDFAARRRKEHARPVCSPTEFLREEKSPQVAAIGNDGERTNRISVAQ